MVWLSWTEQITTKVSSKSSMTLPNSSPLRKIQLYWEKVDCSDFSENWRKMVTLLTKCTRTSILKALSQQEFTASPKCTRIVDVTPLPHFAPSCLLLEQIENWPNKLAKYLCNLLAPHIPTELCATDTFTFLQDIQSLSMYGKFMVSFDVESLFTNKPLEGCIDLAVNYISKGNPDLKLSKPELRSVFTVATTQTHILFNGSFYDQMDGVAMGSPLAPV